VVSHRSNMRLLYFAAHQAWPLTSGNRLRDYHQARELAKRGPVTFVEMCHPGEEPSSVPSGSGFEEVVSLRKGAGYTAGKIVRGMAGSTPLTALNYFEPQAEAQLAKLLASREFSTVQLEGVHLSGYLRVIQTAVHRSAILVDWHNIESELMWRYSENEPLWPKRMVAKRTAALLERTEATLLGQCGAHTVASDREKDQLLARNPSANVHVVPNGIDTSYFSPDELADIRGNDAAPASKRCILFVGSMDYHANVDAAIWFAREMWPAIAQKHPELEFLIVGRNPPPALRELASSRVRVTGTVQDVRPFYACAAAAVVPLRVGSGTRLKILEAMAAGVPVVSTRLGAEGIDSTNDVHLLLAEGGSDFVAAVDRVVASPETSSRLTKAARELVIRLYDWHRVGEELSRIHDSLRVTAAR
jgi:polysaccharide biosynthesis protein PslH